MCFADNNLDVELVKISFLLLKAKHLNQKPKTKNILPSIKIKKNFFSSSLSFGWERPSASVVRSLHMHQSNCKQRSTRSNVSLVFGKSAECGKIGHLTVPASRALLLVYKSMHLHAGVKGLNRLRNFGVWLFTGVKKQV